MFGKHFWRENVHTQTYFFDAGDQTKVYQMRLMVESVGGRNPKHSKFDFGFGGKT